MSAPTSTPTSVPGGSGVKQPLPGEVVLPRAYYAVLLVETVALLWFYSTREVLAGDRIGLTLGWAGVASMCVMHVYSIRRRVRALSGWGKLSTWLHVHIFLGLQGALLVCFHSAHLTSMSNISGATIACTLVVVASGMFGRYLFSFLPKGVSGQRLTAAAIEAEMSELRPAIIELGARQPALQALVAESEDAPAIDKKLTFGQLVAEDVRARRALRHLDKALREATRREGASAELQRFGAVLRRRAMLARRLAMLTAAERMFRNWHVLHKPLTYILAGVALLHVFAHYMYAAQLSG